MAAILIVYGSTIGNTREAAEMLEETFKGAGAAVTLLDVSDAAPDGLCADYDLVLFGCSTWGDEDIELQPDFVPLFESFDKIAARGKKVAVFGCGDSSYKWFCGAVDAIEEKLKQLGAELLNSGLKIDGDPGEAGAEINAWAGQLVKVL